MMDWTDRHCRYFLRLIAPRARLYTEMITGAALEHGDVPYHLDFDPAEHPLALQLGGSDPRQLAAGCAGDHLTPHKGQLKPSKAKQREACETVRLW